MANTDIRCYDRTWLRSRALRAMPVALCMTILTLLSCSGSDEPVSERQNVTIEADWSGCGNNVPSGMTVIFHHELTGERTRIIDNNTACVPARLAPGRYRAVVFSLSEEEYSGVRFRGLDNADTPEAYAAPMQAPEWYDRTPAPGSYLALQPEWLAADTILTAAVAQQQHDATETQRLGTLHPHAITRSLHITIHVDNISNLAAARGALGGLASGYYIAADMPAESGVTATHLLDPGAWTRTALSSTSPLSSSTDSGIIEADLQCFGLPADHRGTPDENILQLEMLLADGSGAVRCELKAGHLIKESASPAGTLSLELSLDRALPPRSDAGGMDVWFDDWDERLDLNLPL